ncbi:MAG: type II toxin-antitoxin system HicA family toxin [Muribaculaceae bacterium]
MSNDNNSNMKRYKVKEVIELLEQDGWYKIATKGDHRQFKHHTKKGKVTIRGHEREDLSQFLLNSIWKQAGWK